MNKETLLQTYQQKDIKTKIHKATDANKPTERWIYVKTNKNGEMQKQFNRTEINKYTDKYTDMF